MENYENYNIDNDNDNDNDSLSSIKLGSEEKSKNILLRFLINPTKKNSENKKLNSNCCNFFYCLFFKK